MQNKKLYLILAVVVVVVAGAAFIGGRLLNGQAGPLGLLPFGNGNGAVSIAINMTPAPELPTTRPEATGTFVERKDNTITVQTISMKMGSGGGVVVEVGPGGDTDGPITSDMGGDGPKVEVVVTNETTIYRDATDLGEPPTSGNETITVQQVVEPGTLDDLTTQSMVQVWGRKNGDRIIADMIVYSNPVIFKRPAP
jgi:hypothetical protein